MAAYYFCYWYSNSAGGDCHSFQPYWGAEFVIYFGPTDTVYTYGSEVDQGLWGEVAFAS